MARDVDTLVLAMHALLCPLMFELDPICPPILFNDEVRVIKIIVFLKCYVSYHLIKQASMYRRTVHRGCLVGSQFKIMIDARLLLQYSLDS